jgi:hypothetical protein
MQKVRVNSQRDLRGWRIATRDAEWPAIKPLAISHIGQATGRDLKCDGQPGQMLPCAKSCIHAHWRSVNSWYINRVEYSRAVFLTVNRRWDVEMVATRVMMTFVIPGWRCPYCDKFQEMGTTPVWKTTSAIPQQTVIKPLRNRRPKPQSIRRKTRVSLRSGPQSIRGKTRVSLRSSSRYGDGASELRGMKGDFEESPGGWSGSCS